MTKHLINTLRKSIVGAVLILLPLKSRFLPEPEAIRAPVSPGKDTWLFDAPTTLDACSNDYFQEMDNVAETIGGLKTLVAGLQNADAAPKRLRVETTRVQAIWLDTLLFDGEPGLIECRPAACVDEDDFLFVSSDNMERYAQIVAADQVSLQAANGSSSRIPA